MELAHHCHHGHCGADVVEETDITGDYLQVSMVVGVRVNELDRLLREQGCIRRITFLCVCGNT